MITPKLNRAAVGRPAQSLLTPENCVLLLIDYQAQMLFDVQSSDRQTLVNNVVGLAKAAKAFAVPAVLTTLAAKTFSGPLLPQIQTVFPDQTAIDRTSINAWEDQIVLAAVEKMKRKKLLIGALWTETALTYCALSALEEGYQVYAVADASGGLSPQAHELGLQRMIQGGIIPVTWQQVMCEWQRDWSRDATAADVQEIAEQHAGAFGQGLFYARQMIPPQEEASLTDA